MDDGDARIAEMEQGLKKLYRLWGEWEKTEGSHRVRVFGAMGTRIEALEHAVSDLADDKFAELEDRITALERSK